jgi:hypothetical protein
LYGTWRLGWRSRSGVLGAKLLWRRILCKETALLEGPLVWVGRLHGVVADSGARVPNRASAADASRGRTRFRERTACTWLTSERHAPANRHPLFAAYSCHCHCRLLCPRPGTILIVATQWLFVLYYRFPCRRIFSPEASMHAAKFRATRIQRIRLCAQPQRRLIQTAQCFTDAPRPSQAEVDRARAYCANLLKYCARTSARNAPR